MNAIKGLLFDKDGTLFDFAHTWESWAAAFLLRACEGDAARATKIGADIGFDFARRKFARDSIVIAGTPQEVTQALLPHFPTMSEQSLSDLLNEEAEVAPQMQAVPLIPLLSGLRNNGFKLGVATNDAEQPARAHLAGAGITDLFDFIAGYDTGHGSKPAPGQLFAFAAQVGLDPAKIAMIGDSTHDLRAGRAAGMTTIGVLTGLAEAAELAPFADIVFADIGHLPAWLTGQS